MVEKHLMKQKAEAIVELVGKVERDPKDVEALLSLHGHLIELKQMVSRALDNLKR